MSTPSQQLSKKKAVASLSQHHQKTESPVSLLADLPLREETLHTAPLAPLFAHDERKDVYSGQERKTLQLSPLQRVRELQENNDHLQRVLSRNEKELAHSNDPLSLHAENEQCSILIARNTGEILNIYTLNEQRLKRIAELEAQNVRLQAEISENQDKFIASHEMNARTKHAADFFLSKATYEKNLAEIRELSQQ